MQAGPSRDPRLGPPQPAAPPPQLQPPQAQPGLTAAGLPAQGPPPFEARPRCDQGASACPGRALQALYGLRQLAESAAAPTPDTQARALGHCVALLSSHGQLGPPQLNTAAQLLVLLVCRGHVLPWGGLLLSLTTELTATLARLQQTAPAPPPAQPIAASVRSGGPVEPAASAGRRGRGRGRGGVRAGGRGAARGRAASPGSPGTTSSTDGSDEEEHFGDKDMDDEQLAQMVEVLQAHELTCQLDEDIPLDSNIPRRKQGSQRSLTVAERCMAVLSPSTVVAYCNTLAATKVTAANTPDLEGWDPHHFTADEAATYLEHVLRRLQEEPPDGKKHMGYSTFKKLSASLEMSWRIQHLSNPTTVETAFKKLLEHALYKVNFNSICKLLGTMAAESLHSDSSNWTAADVLEQQHIQQLFVDLHRQALQADNFRDALKHATIWGMSTYSQATLGRSDETRHVMLGNHVLTEMPQIQPARAWKLSHIRWAGKTLKKFKPAFLSAIQHRVSSSCCILALAVILWLRFCCKGTTGAYGESFPLPFVLSDSKKQQTQRSKYWYHFPMFVTERGVQTGRRLNQPPGAMPYTTFLRGLKPPLKRLGVYSARKTHAFRAAGAKQLADAEVSTDYIRAVGWQTDVCMESYIEQVHPTVLAGAGLWASKNDFWSGRMNIAVSPKLVESIFTFAAPLKAAYQQMLRAAERLSTSVMAVHKCVTELYGPVLVQWLVSTACDQPAQLLTCLIWTTLSTREPELWALVNIHMQQRFMGVVHEPSVTQRCPKKHSLDEARQEANDVAALSQHIQPIQQQEQTEHDVHSLTVPPGLTAEVPPASAWLLALASVWLHPESLLGPWLSRATHAGSRLWLSVVRQQAITLMTSGLAAAEAQPVTDACGQLATATSELGALQVMDMLASIDRQLRARHAQGLARSSSRKRPAPSHGVPPPVMQSFSWTPNNIATAAASLPQQLQPELEPEQITALTTSVTAALPQPLPPPPAPADQRTRLLGSTYADLFEGQNASNDFKRTFPVLWCSWDVGVNGIPVRTVIAEHPSKGSHKRAAARVNEVKRSVAVVLLGAAASGSTPADAAEALQKHLHTAQPEKKYEYCCRWIAKTTLADAWVAQLVGRGGESLGTAARTVLTPDLGKPGVDLANELSLARAALKAAVDMLPTSPLQPRQLPTPCKVLVSSFVATQQQLQEQQVLQTLVDAAQSAEGSTPAQLGAACLTAIQQVQPELVGHMQQHAAEVLGRQARDSNTAQQVARPKPTGQTLFLGHAVTKLHAPGLPPQRSGVGSRDSLTKANMMWAVQKTGLQSLWSMLASLPDV